MVFKVGLIDELEDVFLSLRYFGVLSNPFVQSNCLLVLLIDIDDLLKVVFLILDSLSCTNELLCVVPVFTFLDIDIVHSVDGVDAVVRKLSLLCCCPVFS